MGMQFTIRALFIATTVIALYSWVAVVVPELAISIACLAAILTIVPVAIIIPWLVMALIASRVLRGQTQHDNR
jgi:predicted branched-subunit amino acid permease